MRRLTSGVVMIGEVTIRGKATMSKSGKYGSLEQSLGRKYAQLFSETQALPGLQEDCEDALHLSMKVMTMLNHVGLNMGQRRTKQPA